MLSGGTLTVLAGGASQQDRLSGGTELDFGRATATFVLSGALEVVEAKGVVSASLIESGGQLAVSSGGTADQGVVLSGGLEVVSRGGSETSAIIDSGGFLRVSSGGAASATTVSSGGIEDVFAGGLARKTVLSGGTESDSGVTSGTWVRSGGHELVEAHGTATAAVVGVGGLLTVSSGGALAGGLTLWGGKAVISGTMAAGQTATFSGSSAAVLELDNLPGFAAKISGMKNATQQVDLDGFVFSSGHETATWAQSGTSGTLTVTDGAKVAHLTLIGTYTSSNFHLSKDGHGGTFVVDPPPPNPAAPAPAAGFVQAMAALAGDYTACVHSAARQP